MVIPLIVELIVNVNGFAVDFNYIVGNTLGTIVKFTALYLLAPIVQSWTLVVWMNVLVLLPYCIAEHIHLDIRINKLCKMEE